MTTVNYLPLRVVERRDAYGFPHYGRRIEEVRVIYKLIGLTADGETVPSIKWPA